MGVVSYSGFDIHDPLKGIERLKIPGAALESDGFEIRIRGSECVYERLFAEVECGGVFGSYEYDWRIDIAENFLIHAAATGVGAPPYFIGGQFVALSDDVFVSLSGEEHIVRFLENKSAE